MCNNTKCLAKSTEEQYIVTLSTELDKMKDTNIELANLFKSKGTPKGNTNKQVDQIWKNKKFPEQKNDDKFAWDKVPHKKDNRI